MQKIIILGAGIYQVPLIRAAKQMGLYVIVVSIPGNYPGFALADKVYEINTTDKEAILSISMKEQISAIATTGTDVAVATIGYVCQKMGLTGIPFEASKLVTDKALMKEAFRRHGVTTAAFEVIHSRDEALAAFQKIGTPAILKIVDKSGSRGITRVDTEEQLLEAYTYAESCTNADHMVLERFIIGKEIGIDAFVQNGKMQLFVPHDKLVYQTNRTSVPMGHICPITASESLYETMKTETEKAIYAVGLDNCAVNLDLLVTDRDEVYVIEIAGRCGATGIPEVISGYLGIDYYAMILRNALGESMIINPKQAIPTASVLMHSESTGILQSIEYDFDGVHYCNTDSAVSSAGFVQLDFKPGAEVHAFENGTHRIGQAICSAETLEDVQRCVNRFQNSICVSVENTQN